MAKKEKIYQIYTSTFCDSNGDGLGDIKGITQRLDYIKEQHYDAIWLNPIYLSPEGREGDGGYAITDHTKINPKFGTDDDFNELLEKAHEKGLRVYVDFVPCHTANDHKWFKASEDPHHPQHEKYKNYYVWHDGKRDEQGNLIRHNGRTIPPNNWASVFGGTAWQYSEKRGQWYLHHFHTSQPALNLNDPVVQQAQLDTMKHWLDDRTNKDGKKIRGVDGLRIDAIPFANYDPQFRDNPIIKERSDWDNVWRKQYFQYSTHQTQTKEFVAKIRALMDSYPKDHPKKAIGEVVAGRLGGDNSMDYAMELLDPEKGLHSCYTQSFVDLAWFEKRRLEAANLRSMIRRSINMDPTGKLGHAKDNHDFPRFASRMTDGTPYNLRDKVIKQLVTMWMCLPGDKFEYNGSELGLTQATDKDVPEKVTDPSDEKRDQCRTPIPFDDTLPNAGFSTSEKPLLPVAESHMARSVRLQREQPDSLLNFNQRINQQWEENPALQEGETILLETHDPIVAFIRKTKDQAVLCAVNISDKIVHFTPSEYKEMTPEILHLLKMSSGDEVHMGAYGSSVIGLAHTKEGLVETGMQPSEGPQHANGVLTGKMRGRGRTLFVADMLFADNHIYASDVPAALGDIIREHPELETGGKLAIDEEMHKRLLAESAQSPNNDHVPLTFGGSTGVTMWTLRKLLPHNTKINFLGCTADDMYGRVAKRFADEAGFNLLVPRWPGNVPQKSAATHVIKLPSGRNTIVSYPGKQIEVIHRALEENPRLLEDAIKDSHIVYMPESTIGKFGLPFAWKLLEQRWIHNKELVVSLPTQADFGPGDSNFFQYLIPSANVVLGNDIEFCRIYGIDTARPVSRADIDKVTSSIQHAFAQGELIKKPGMPCSSYGQVAFITRGRDPALIVTKDKVIEIPAVEGLKLKSRIGVDHTANAAFLSGYIKGYDHELSARMAMEMAAQKIEQEGPEPYLREPQPLQDRGRPATGIAL